MDNAASYLDDGIFAQLRQDFLIDARERLDAMESAAGGAEAQGDGAQGGGVQGGGAQGGGAQDGGALLTVRREAHSLKGLAGSLGFPSITIIAHRLEDFVGELNALAGQHVTDVLAYIDCLRGIVDQGRDPGDEKTSEILRSLPAHTFAPAKPGDFEVGRARRVEVLLIAPGRAVRRMIANELRALGFRVSTAESPWHALEVAARTRPDLVITSAVLDHLTGIDLARALRAIAPTQGLPLALLTSLEPDHPDLARLPPDVAVVQLNQAVTDQLGDLITQFDLG